ncbi:MAG TPA: hypothetical protein DEF34_03300 [Desulfotomaculum sp.]|nr:MAG: hypothetical protein JL56_02915 [Desulfotomaculum sp. BICA1-6]HBX22654.1 hypothetical protein [Desulfotomaculum sp.]
MKILLNLSKHIFTGLVIMPIFLVLIWLIYCLFIGTLSYFVGYAIVLAIISWVFIGIYKIASFIINYLKAKFR